MYQQPQPMYQQQQVPTYQQQQPMQLQPMQQPPTQPKKDVVEFLKENWGWCIVGIIILLYILDYFNVIKINFNFRNSDSSSNTGAPNTEATPTGANTTEAPTNTNPVLRRYPAAVLVTDENRRYIDEKIKQKENVTMIFYCHNAVILDVNKNTLTKKRIGNVLIIYKLNVKLGQTIEDVIPEILIDKSGYKDREIENLTDFDMSVLKKGQMAWHKFGFGPMDDRDDGISGIYAVL